MELDLIKIMEKIREEEKIKRQFVEELEKLYYMDKTLFLRKIDEYFENGKVDVLLTQSRKHTLIYIFPLINGEKRICSLVSETSVEIEKIKRREVKTSILPLT